MPKTKTNAKIDPYPINTPVRITASGGRAGDWWGRVAIALATFERGGYYYTNIQLLHPQTGELTQLTWRTEWLEVLPDGEQLEEVQALRDALALSHSLVQTAPALNSHSAASAFDSNSSLQKASKSQPILFDESSKPNTTPIPPAGITDDIPAPVEEVALVPEELELPVGNLAEADQRAQTEPSRLTPLVSSEYGSSLTMKAQVPIGTCENIELVDNCLGGSELMSELVVLPPVMTEDEARRCLQEIKGLFDLARAKLLEFKERRGWEALNYPHLTACLEDYFPESRTKLVRELFAAEIERDVLQVPIGTCPASHFRPLRKIKPSQYKSALHKAYELAGGARLRTSHVTRAVSEILSPARFVKKTLPSKYQPGELVRIQCQALALPEQKAWDGCWALVQSTGNISCVRVLVGNKEVDYMAGDLDWDDNIDPQFGETCNRIMQLWQKTELEPVEENLLKFLQRRQFFTDLEKQIISLMEAKH